MSKYTQYVEQFAAMIISDLEKGTAPWRKGWDVCPNAFDAVNPTNGTHYHGFNCLVLGAAALKGGFKSSSWMTFKQAKELGGVIRKGSKGIKCYKYGKYTPKNTEGEEEEEERGYMAGFVLFNVDQIDGLPEEYYPKADNSEKHNWNPEEKAERILNGSGARIRYFGGEANYNPFTDSITLPERDKFFSAVAFYDTALHELGHWTGYPSRLNRKFMSCDFGTPGYAREELRAEIASYMLASRLGIPHDAANHNAYIANWIRIIKDRPREIVEACADAEKIVTYLLALADKNAPEAEKKEEKPLLLTYSEMPRVLPSFKGLPQMKDRINPFYVDNPDNVKNLDYWYFHKKHCQWQFNRKVALIMIENRDDMARLYKAGVISTKELYQFLNTLSDEELTRIKSGLTGVVLGFWMEEQEEILKKQRQAEKLARLIALEAEKEREAAREAFYMQQTLDLF